jgi:hypothetical protein
MKFWILVAIYATCLGGESYAETVLDTGLLFQSDGQGSKDSSSNETDLLVNLNWDLMLGGEIFVGAKLILSLSRTTAASSTPVLNTYFAPGFNFGYGNADHGFRIAGFATLSPTEKSSGDFEYARYGGMGYGAELSYLVKAGSIGLGPKLTYLVDNSTHENVDGNYSKLAEPATRTRVLPQMVLVKRL